MYRSNFLILALALLSGCAAQQVQSDVAEQELSEEAAQILADAESEPNPLEGVDGMAELEQAIADEEAVAEVTPKAADKPKVAIRKRNRAFVKKDAPVKPAAVVAEAPGIEKAPLLNRFYFLRSGDTPETLAELFFKDRAKADDLRKWNSSTEWQAGKTIYYLESSTPDSKLISFYEDRKIVPLTYEVSQGETLGSVAKRLYQTEGSRSELAWLNRMKPLEVPKTGLRLSFYPATFESGVTRELASIRDEQLARPAVYENQKPKHEKKMASPEVGGIFAVSLKTWMICGGIFAAIGGIWMLSRRKKANRFDI